MLPRQPWTEAQNEIVRKHYMLPGVDLLPLVNAVGPKRTVGSVVTRRAFLGVWKARPPSGSRLQMQAIAARVAAQHGLTLADLQGPSRKRPVYLARQQAMAECYATGGFSYITIGKFFGGRDHTTAMNAVKTYQPLAQQEAA
jgi:hypothetical protein